MARVHALGAHKKLQYCANSNWSFFISNPYLLNQRLLNQYLLNQYLLN